MDKQGLLFIPDISGFTRFVTGMEIEHSRTIIQRLLEVLIDANQLGLAVSEVEGDAILFYRFGERPGMQQVYAQVERMFQDFHRHLRTYDQRRLCQCGPCRSAVDLSLKVVTHYGEFTGYTVKQFSKLIGKDVIVAHQLLKNDIEQHEYWLATDELLPHTPPEPLTGWMRWEASLKRTETGEVRFHYTQLAPLKEGIAPTPLPALEPPEAEEVLSVQRDFDMDSKRLFYTAGHTEFRHRWMEGVRAVEEIDHFIPQLGTRYRCIRTDGSEMVMVSSSFSFDPEGTSVYSETDEAGTRTVRYGFTRLGEGRCRFRIDLLLKKDPALIAAFERSEKARLQQELERSLDNLERLAPTVEPPVDF